MVLGQLRQERSIACVNLVDRKRHGKHLFGWLLLLVHLHDRLGTFAGMAPQEKKVSETSKSIGDSIINRSHIYESSTDSIFFPKQFLRHVSCGVSFQEKR